ncbi:hypothetical protein AGMMS50256_07580 [Betaproteobacteria bacterium]|nr:hypothetical protein AGMMS50256_07580 [Betaproteobacteria bacterium]
MNKSVKTDRAMDLPIAVIRGKPFTQEEIKKMHETPNLPPFLRIPPLEEEQSDVVQDKDVVPADHENKNPDVNPD